VSQITEGYPDYSKWNIVKQDMLASILENKPGFLVADSSIIEAKDLNHYYELMNSCCTYKVNHSYLKNDIYFLFKEKWSLDELYAIAIESSFNQFSEVWMLPNMVKMMPKIVAEKFYSLIYYNYDPYVFKNGLETIGCAPDGDSILWANPRPDAVDSVVNNLKKLCLEFQIELIEH